MGTHNRTLGADGEAAALAWYVAHGYDERARNWRCRDGEIDLVVATRQMLVICEVKTRSSQRFGSGAEAVDWRKQRTIRIVAARYLAANPVTPRTSIRFDVAVVTPRAHGFAVDVIEGAF